MDVGEPSMSTYVPIAMSGKKLYAFLSKAMTRTWVGVPRSDSTNLARLVVTVEAAPNDQIVDAVLTTIVIEPPQRTVGVGSTGGSVTGLGASAKRRYVPVVVVRAPDEKWISAVVVNSVGPSARRRVTA